MQKLRMHILPRSTSISALTWRYEMINIPQSPNRFENGYREGTWTVLLADETRRTGYTFIEVEDVADARFFTVVQFSEGKPAGEASVRYKSDSIAHWTGELLRVNPYILADGDHIFYHLNGSIERTFTMRSGKVEGVEVRYFNDGGKNCEAFYSDGIIRTIVCSRHANGNKRIEYVFNDTDETCDTLIEYLESGIKRYESQRKNGEKDGIDIWYYKNGQRQYELPYRNGKMQGTEKSWYQSGARRYEKEADGPSLWGEHYVSWHENGRKKTERWRGGFARGWYLDGTPRYEIPQINGVIEGIASFWYENGIKQVETPFRAARKHGIEVSWYESGAKESETMYAEGKKDGAETHWDEEGKLIVKRLWKNGVAATREQPG